ncbi:hypothetical protein SDC9_168368 [bioreactor metagenome]|uniref:Uncharacterized protein n=1 Tax=bioreactor metagenome TaxID=1076179 RepID=A0A645G5B6_9ZZZZ
MIADLLGGHVVNVNLVAELAQAIGHAFGRVLAGAAGHAGNGGIHDIGTRFNCL